ATLVAALDRAPLTLHLLVDLRPVLAQGPCRGLESQISPPVDVDPIHASEGDADRLRPGPGRHHEVVFEIIRPAVEDQIDPWIELVVPDSAVMGDIRHPPGGVGTEEVMAACDPGFEA